MTKMVAFSLAGSPFVVLPVTPRSNKDQIEAAFEERRAARPAAEPVFADARQRLLSPDGRLAAELAWIIDVGPLTANVLLEAMGRGDPTVLLAALAELPPLTKANVAADACIRLRSTTFVAPLEAAHRGVDFAAVTALINEIHAVAGEPAQQAGDVSAAFAALTERHAAAALEAMAAQGNSQEVLSDLLRAPRAGASRFVDEVLAQYYQGVSQPFTELEAETDRALARLTDGRDAVASEVLDILPKWRALSQPALRHAKGLGLDDPRSLRLYGKIRNACLYLANDRRQSSAAAEILVALHGAFEDLPSSNADIEGDQAFLKKLAAAAEAESEPTSAASYQASPTRAAEKPSRDYLSRFPRPSIRLTAPGSRDAIIWVLVGLIVLATLGFIVFEYRAALFSHPGGETVSRSFSAPAPPGPASVPPPARAEPRPTSDKSLLAVIPGGGSSETRPPTGQGLLLSKSQLRYCMFNKERLNNVDPTIKTLAFMSKLDSVVADFNARCGRVKYMSEDFEGVSAELDSAQPRLRQEAEALAKQWTR